MSADVLIEPEALHDLVGRDDVKILDASFVLPNAGIDPRANFESGRIGEAQFFDFKEICDHNSPLPHMLPSAGEFAAAVAALGISSDNLVVLYAQDGMVMGPARAWWMFRVFGHDRVRVLNGGLPAWKAAGLPVHTDSPAPPAPGIFEAAYRSGLVASMDEVRAASHSGAAHIVDARPAERFRGATPEPRPGMRAGHIPGSVNCPASSLVDPATGKMKSAAEVHALIGGLGLEDGKPVIASCGSGVTACFVALGMFIDGKTDVAVYDGSWAEWGREEAGTPVSK